MIPSVTGSVVSSETWYSMSRGNRVERSAIVALILFATSSAFVPGIWKTAMTADGLPLCRPYALYSCVPSSRRATSLRRTSEPSAFARTMISPNSASSSRRPLVRTAYVNSVPGFAGGPPICPAGLSWFCWLTALTISGTVIPSLAIRSGRSQTRMA